MRAKNKSSGEVYPRLHKKENNYVADRRGLESTHKKMKKHRNMKMSPKLGTINSRLTVLREKGGNREAA